MSGRAARGWTAAEAGLCAACRNARAITSRRGSRFLLCDLSRTEPRFARYPRLPVLECTGFAPVTAADADRPTEPEREP